MTQHATHVSTTLDPEFFEDPSTFPGATSRMLSPDEVWDWAEPCGPVGAVAPHFGLAEDAVESIQKRGIRICGHDFTGPYLMPWTTGDKKAPNNMFIRYDRALAARGTLREVELLLEHHNGTRELVAVLHRDVEMPDRSSVAEFRKAFKDVLAGLFEELEEQDDAYRRLEAHEAALEDFYHSRPKGGASRIPLTKPWREAERQAPPTRVDRVQQQKEVIDALSSGVEGPAVDDSQRRTGPGRSVSTSGSDGLAEMLTAPEGTETSRDPDPDPENRGRPR